MPKHKNPPKHLEPALSAKCLAEVMATFAVVFFGCGAVMVGDRFPGSMAPGAVAVVFGIVVAMGVYAFGHISGAHMNPACTLAFAAVGRIEKRYVAPYCLSQVLGASLAMLVLVAILPEGKLFGATVPSILPWQALVWEFILTFFLMFSVMAIATEDRIEGPFAGLIVGAVVCLEAFVAGPITGASMNPARSLAPNILQAEMGVMWIYIAGPIAGAVAASLLYRSIFALRAVANETIEQSSGQQTTQHGRRA